MVAAVAATCAVALLAPAEAEQRKIVDGVAINIGVVPAAPLLKADAYERASHRGAQPDATHHVVVGVSDARSGVPIGDARVTVELTDPHGATQRRPLLRGDAGGVPDYSELFRFGWAGDYRLQVTVQRDHAAPVQSVFRWTQTY
jgi:hypothetical protein